MIDSLVFVGSRVAESLREKIWTLEKNMRDLPQLDIPIEHFFCEGVYARKMTMPKGSLVIGKIHLHSQINILSMGDMSVAFDDCVVRMKAGDHVVCPIGAKRAFYAHEDSSWTVILRTDETDIEKIEAEFVVETEREYLDFKKWLS